MAKEKIKYRRRKYGDDVVIYTTSSGHFCTISARNFQEPWKVAGELIRIFNEGG